MPGCDKVDLALYIFRRDLRLEDNNGLNAALASSAEVIPAFILDPRQYEDHPFRSHFGAQFLHQSLRDLNRSLEGLGSRLFLFKGIAEEVVETLLEGSPIDGVFFNEDYTPFSTQRDTAIRKVCEQAGRKVSCRKFPDTLLFEPGTVVKDDGTPYTVYSAFAKKALKSSLPVPLKQNAGSFFTRPVPREQGLQILEKIFPQDRLTSAMNGERSTGLSVLKELHKFARYDEERNIPSLSATTHLSAHHKFGTVSVRETATSVQTNFSEEHSLIKELLWRDFFTHIAFFYPHVFQGAFHKKYDSIKWENNEEKFALWMEGKTGFPIVDAGLRELVQTGFMHNRVRMIVGSFLVKNLHISWQWGEKFFARNLVDYDPAVNNGNWQWVASTGCDATPYFRIFNPWLQQKKFDPETRYIKRWIPELQGLSSKEIHNLESKSYKVDYPRPCVSHTETANRAQRLFSDLKI
jgi:deoxyribodipyrimidine photo-lyase